MSEEFTKKERVVNCWLLPNNLSISEIAELVDCSYEYARRIIRKIESGDINPHDLASDKLQSHLSEQLESPLANIMEFDMKGSELNSEESSKSESDVNSPPDDDFEEDVLTATLSGDHEDPDESQLDPEETAQESDNRFVHRQQLEQCLPIFSELQTQAKYHVEQGNDSADMQYYVAQRAVQLTEHLLAEYNEKEIPKEKIWYLVRIFKELYLEADFEAGRNKPGAQQKRYAAIRIADLLESIAQQDD